MRFARHLAAAALAIAVVIVLTVFADHLVSATLTGGGTTISRVNNVPVQGPPQGRVVMPGFSFGLTSMFDPANWPDLRHTVVIETALLAAVIIIDVIRRRMRRADRTRHQQ
ncbi:MAG TPA: hypothetical protein VGG25_24155 [Streptosporangiaceae bacterium]|jgi:hypothetical protein